VLKEKRGLNQECFDRLLNWLGPDREAGADEYEKIRRRLIQIFVSRGSPAPEDLADRTIDRVCEKLAEIVAVYSGDPALYFYGVAHIIHLESFRNKRISYVVPKSNQESDIERTYKCLDQCIASLPEETRGMVLDYYREDGLARIESRKVMAKELGIRVEALRLRMYRIRLDLNECVRACLNQNENR
jgi:DNA-directed RNA polymerase specialized sigma24 family protein